VDIAIYRRVVPAPGRYGDQRGKPASIWTRLAVSRRRDGLKGFLKTLAIQDPKAFHQSRIGVAHVVMRGIAHFTPGTDSPADRPGWLSEAKSSGHQVRRHKVTHKGDMRTRSSF
jgi:hypothetical protein